MKAKSADWERIEIDYRAGVRSLREIASEHEITEGAIRKKAKQYGWERDLSAKVRAKADALVRKEQVRAEVRAGADYKATENETVDVEAKVLARVQISHRTDIAKSRTVFGKLMSELEHQTDNSDIYEQLAEMVIADAEPEGSEASRARAQKMRQAFDKALSLSGRSGTLKSLVESAKTLIALEREAFGLDKGASNEAGSIEEFIEALRSPTT